MSLVNNAGQGAAETGINDQRGHWGCSLKSFPAGEACVVGHGRGHAADAAEKVHAGADCRAERSTEFTGIPPRIASASSEGLPFLLSIFQNIPPKTNAMAGNGATHAVTLSVTTDAAFNLPDRHHKCQME